MFLSLVLVLLYVNVRVILPTVTSYLLLFITTPDLFGPGSLCRVPVHFTTSVHQINPLRCVSICLSMEYWVTHIRIRK